MVNRKFQVFFSFCELWMDFNATKTSIDLAFEDLCNDVKYFLKYLQNMKTW